MEVVRELLRGGASIDQADNYGATPLFMASLEGRAEVVRELLTAGADHTLARDIIDDKKKVTPLEAARCEGHHSLVQLLQEYGALA